MLGGRACCSTTAWRRRRWRPCGRSCSRWRTISSACTPAPPCSAWRSSPEAVQLVCERCKGLPSQHGHKVMRELLCNVAERVRDDKREVLSVQVCCTLWVNRAHKSVNTHGSTPPDMHGAQPTWLQLQMQACTLNGHDKEMHCVEKIYDTGTSSAVLHSSVKAPLCSPGASAGRGRLCRDEK